MSVKYPTITIAAAVLLFLNIDCHPQCLDFRAPFTPMGDVSFCSEYTETGCCGSEDTDRLREEYESIQRRVRRQEWEQCQGFVKDILCQKCSPYAAHLYDAEGTSQPRDFPGLCTSYCNDFYDQCRRMIWYLDPDLARRSMFASRRRFCNRVALSDVDYCYPDLKTNPMLVRNLTETTTTTGAPDCLCLDELKNDLANPLWARHAGDGSGRLFVAEQVGRVRIYNTQTKTWQSGCFLDFTDKAEVSRSAGDEKGFLGMAFHPNYRNNGRFFVYYSTSTKSDDVLPPELQSRNFPFRTKIVISEMSVNSQNPNKADPGSEKVLLQVFQPYANHNGGELLFGVDGYLYAFIGDGGAAGDPMDAGQDKTLLHGKAIRVDVDSDPGQPYTIPPDNPFVGDPNAKPEIYAYGIRNIWRCGLDQGDRTTGESRGRILCGDVGQNRYEEIDLLKKGANYGWNAREGFECYDDELCGSIGTEELPIHAYPHSVGKSVTGGVFYRGCENPALNGQYIYGDYVSSRLFSLSESGGSWTNKDVNLCGSLCQGSLVGSLNDYILSFGEDEEGEIYILTSSSSRSNGRNGKIFKILDPATRNDPSSCGSNPNLSRRVPLPPKDALLENVYRSIANFNLGTSSAVGLLSAVLDGPGEAAEAGNAPAVRPPPLQISIKVRTWKKNPSRNHNSVASTRKDQLRRRNRSRQRLEKRLRRRHRQIKIPPPPSLHLASSSSQRKEYDMISQGGQNRSRGVGDQKSNRLSRRLSGTKRKSDRKRRNKKRRERRNRKRSRPDLNSKYNSSAKEQ